MRLKPYTSALMPSPAHKPQTIKATIDSVARGRDARGGHRLADAGVASIERFAATLIGVKVILLLWSAYLWGGHNYPFWFDELFTVGTSAGSFATAWQIALSDNHPPLFPLLMWLWLRAAPVDELWARLPSVVFALLLVPVMLGLRSRLAPPAVVVGTLITISGFFWGYYAAEARGYMLMMFLSALCLWCAVHRRHSLLAAACIALGLTHFFGTLLASTYLLYLFAHPQSPARTRWVAFACQIIISLYPAYHVLMGMGRDSLGGRFWIDSSPLEAVTIAFGGTMEAPVTLMMAARQWLAPNAQPVPELAKIAAALILLPPLMLAYHRFRSRQFVLPAADSKVIGLLALQLALCFTAIALISLHTPIAVARYCIVFTPAGGLLLGYVIYLAAQTPRASVRWTLCALLVLVVVASNTAASAFLKKRFITGANWQTFGGELAAAARNTAGELYYLTPNKETALDAGTRAAFTYYLPADVTINPVKPRELGELGEESVVAVRTYNCASSDATTPEGRASLAALEEHLALFSRAQLEVSWHQSNNPGGSCELGYVVVERAAPISNILR